MLGEWHIDPRVIENEWTDEFYNLMLMNYLERVVAENRSIQQEPDLIQSTEETGDASFMRALAKEHGHVMPYPNVEKTDGD